MAVKKTKKKRTKKRKSSKKKNNKLVLPITIFVILITIVFFFFIYGYKLSLPKPPDNLLSPSNPQPDTIDIVKPDLSEAILHSIKLLGIEPGNIHSYTKDGVQRYKITIDKSRMDLNFANLIITGQIEISGGQVDSARELYNNQRQIMDISDSEGNKFLITLVYSKESTVVDNQSELAIVIDDFGYFDSDYLQEFLDMDKNITFSILPLEHFSVHVMNKAVEAGHETMIHMPMEPIDYPHHNPGPNAIYVHMKEKEIRNMIQKYIKALPLCIGSNNHMGSLVTSDCDVMKIVLEEINKNKLYFIDSRTSVNSVAYDVARDMMVPAFKNSMFLDSEPLNDTTYQNKLKRLKKMSQSNTKMLVIAHCNTKKQLRYLKRFINDVKDNYKLIPVSRLFSSNLPDIL